MFVTDRGFVEKYSFIFSADFDAFAIPAFLLAACATLRGDSVAQVPFWLWPFIGRSCDITFFYGVRKKSTDI